jgi:hypothetical protein
MSLVTFNRMQDVVAGVWNVKHQRGHHVGMLRDGKQTSMSGQMRRGGV